MTLLIPDNNNVNYESIEMWWEGNTLHTIDKEKVHRVYTEAKVISMSLEPKSKREMILYGPPIPEYGKSPLLNVFSLMKEFEYAQEAMRGWFHPLVSKEDGTV